MTIFFQGTLQDGIAQAVSEAKAVVCFVRDEAQASSTWENEYFADEELSNTLALKAVVLRLDAGSQEAGFLTSFCPIAKFPTVVVIQNGTLAEYLVPEIPKSDFQNRLTAALTKGDSQNTAQPVQDAVTPGERESTPVTNPSLTTASSPPPSSAAVAGPPSQNTTRPPAPASQSQKAPLNKAQQKSPTKKAVPSKTPETTTPRSQPAADHHKKPAPISQLPPQNTKASSSHVKAEPEPAPAPKVSVPRGPPTQYRLQVRLFDGSSVRSSFTPTQKISTDVRPWLDAQMGEEPRPYNLKHILTPLPNRTLSVSEESMTLQELGLGSTANLVMVPVASYTNAYAAAAGSLPVRGASAIYNVVSSVAGTASEYVGSLIGYSSSASPSNENNGSPGNSAPSSQRSRPSGPNIRTLNDQRNEREGDRQFYNGNQLDFEPRQDRKGD